MALTPTSTPPTSASSSPNSTSDIWCDSPTATAPSEISHLRTQHFTAGYREGFSSAKEKSLQTGFDEGYPLGATFGLRKGYLLGILDGLVGTFSKSGDRKERSKYEKLLEDAHGELKSESLYGREFFGENAIWIYEVKGEEAGEVTFREVVEQHPVIQKWVGIVKEEMDRWGLKEDP